LEGAEQKLRDVSCPNEGTNTDAAKAVESVMAARCVDVEEYRQKERKARGRRDTMVLSFVPFCDVFKKNEDFAFCGSQFFCARESSESNESSATTKRWDFDPDVS
jgi:hypothetical protein